MISFMGVTHEALPKAVSAVDNDETEKLRSLVARSIYAALRACCSMRNGDSFNSADDFRNAFRLNVDMRVHFMFSCVLRKDMRQLVNWLTQLRSKSEC